MKPETERWVNRSENDMRAARLMLQDGLFGLCIFECQQGLEKLLKAHLTERGERIRKTHDLVGLIKRLGLQLDPSDLDFLGRLTEQYIPTRYGDEPVEYPRELGESYYETAERLYQWLRQQLS